MGPSRPNVRLEPQAAWLTCAKHLFLPRERSWRFGRTGARLCNQTVGIKEEIKLLAGRCCPFPDLSIPVRAAAPDDDLSGFGPISLLERDARCCSFERWSAKCP